MKLMRLAVTAVFLLGFSSAYAFHDGGVADCGGCHTMHKQDSTGTVIGASNTNLLASDNVSDTCLGCHALDQTTGSSFHVLSTTTGAYGAGVAPAERSPGGDFGWLLKSYAYTVRGSTVTWQPGGHHIVAPLFLPYPPLADQMDTAPGGTFPTASLGCSSCHDPHSKARTDATGNFVAVNANKIIGSGSYPTLQTPATGEAAISAYGVYRFLYTNNAYYTGAGYAGPVPATIQSGAVTFNTAPLAVAPSTYNQSEAINQVRVAYANLPSRTMGLWCASCHPAMHTNSGKIVHPIDASLNTGGELGYYNTYVNSGNKTGTQATSFLSLVQFGMDGASRATLAGAALSNSPTYGGPANATDTVMCLSCHRAHASAFEHDIRWEYDIEFITYADSVSHNPVWPGTDNVGTAVQYARGKTSTEQQAGYYDRPVSLFGAYQRSLCNKCHLQD